MSSILIVIDNPKDWPLSVEGIDCISARQYLTDPTYSLLKTAKVFNLCKSYRYQNLGYYVSLLAQARGHKVLPDISTIQDLKQTDLVRGAGYEIADSIQETLENVPTAEPFVLSVYFGRNVEKKYDKLALALFNQFPAPFLRTQFRHDGTAWYLEGVRTIAANEIPPDHFLDVLSFATQYFLRPHRKVVHHVARYEMAILHDKTLEKKPSDEKAIRKFVKAAESMGFDTEIIGKDDYGRIPEFDALFIRDTTSVNHYTFRFARRAATEGLVVMDDPESIVRCSNKVYLAELLNHHRIATPPTLILHRDNWESGPAILGLPLVLKQPDSSFSLGVIKIKTQEEYEREVERLFKVSDLLIGQAFMPTGFDWRIGVLDREPLFACKYYMADNHWQIYDNSKTGDDALGNFETWPIDAVPPDVVKNSLRVANFVGDGLYGVDLKDINGKAYIIEINDNPNIDAGIEDKILGDEMYMRVMRVFLRRLESRGR